MYIIKEELKDYGFGEEKVYNIYFKNKKEEVYDTTYNIKEKAEKYVNMMNL